MCQRQNLISYYRRPRPHLSCAGILYPGCLFYDSAYTMPVLSPSPVHVTDQPSMNGSPALRSSENHNIQPVFMVYESRTTFTIIVFILALSLASRLGIIVFIRRATAGILDFYRSSGASDVALAAGHSSLDSSQNSEGMV